MKVHMLASRFTPLRRARIPMAPAPIPTLLEGALRIQALSPTLVRLEVKGARGFEDRATFHVVERAWPGVPARRQELSESLALRTDGWVVRVRKGARDLRDVRITRPDGSLLWTFDGHLSSAEWLPAPGAMSQAWAIADTPRIVPPPWGLTPAPMDAALSPTSGWDVSNGAPDMYVFLPAGDYRVLRRDFLRLTGPVELPPLYALGYMHSRFMPFGDRAGLGILREYRERGLPVDVLVVDTDWRVSASHGYEENKALFPRMDEFLRQVHDLKAHVMFNDHPEPQALTALDPRELDYRFEGLSRWLQEGLDFWWFDRNWPVGIFDPMPGLFKEVWGMKMYRDMTLRMRPNLRPLIMANVDGILNGIRKRPSDMAAHRYPIQWTGDTWSEWDYLRCGVENAVHAGVAELVPYMSEDLGGHQGCPSVELYVRWLQYGALSTILRPHSSNSVHFHREPWSFGPEALAITGAHIRLHYRMLPHLYARARANHETGEPLLQRLDLLFPECREAARNDQYLFLENLLVAPILCGEEPHPEVPSSWLRTPEGEEGLRLELFPNENLLGEPVVVRREARVGMGGAGWPPAPGLPPTHLSARWTGSVTPGRAVHLGLQADEGCRLWLDDRLVLDQWQATVWDQGLDLGEVLEPGRTRSIRIEYRQGEGEARCVLFHRPMDLPARPVSRSVWIPRGPWIDLWTGERLHGPRTLETAAPAARMPLFMRAGSLLVLAPEALSTEEMRWDHLALEIFPDPERPGRTDLYEDDRLSLAHLDGIHRRTLLEAREEGRELLVTLGAARGGYRDGLATRTWILRIHLREGMREVASVGLDPGTDLEGRWKRLPRDPDYAFPVPFPLSGPAPDADVLEVRLPAFPLYQERKVRIRFEER